MFNRIVANWRKRKDDGHRLDLLQRIERFGLTAIYVGDYSTSPTWAYSIGFHASLGAPEVIVFDLPQEPAVGLFHEIYGDLKAGMTIKDGDPWRAGEFEQPLTWRQVHPSRLYDNDSENPWMGLAEDFAAILAPEKGPIAAYQLVMSDANGNMPWDPAYDERLRHLQRALWEPLELAASAPV